MSLIRPVTLLNRVMALIVLLDFKTDVSFFNVSFFDVSFFDVSFFIGFIEGNYRRSYLDLLYKNRFCN